MSDTSRRRALMRHGFFFLFAALIFGLAIMTVPHPSRWVAGHLTAFLTGLILIVIGLCWSELRLTSRQRSLAYRTGVAAAYAGLVSSTFVAITNLPGPASNPGVMPPMPQAAVLLALLAIIIPCLFISFGLLLFGMRGEATER